MTSDRNDHPQTQDQDVTTRLVGVFSAGWRALTAAYARMTLPTPPVSDAAGSGDAQSRAAKKSKHS